MKISIKDIVLLIVAVCCIVSMGYYLIKGKGKKASSPKNNAKKRQHSIVGASHTKPGQYTAKTQPKEKSSIIPSEELDKVFYTQEQAKLNIDVDIDISDPGVDKEEELFLLTGDNAYLTFASGADFEELSEMSEAIQGHLEELTSTQLEKAGQTINHTQSTNIFNQFIEQVENGEQKVAAILDACEAEAKKTNSISENSDVSSFDLGEWV